MLCSAFLLMSWQYITDSAGGSGAAAAAAFYYAAVATSKEEEVRWCDYRIREV